MSRMLVFSGAFALLLLFGCLGDARQESVSPPSVPKPPEAPQSGPVPQVGDGDIAGAEVDDLDILPADELIPPPEADTGDEAVSGGSVADKLDYSDLFVEEGSDFDEDVISEGEIIEPI